MKALVLALALAPAALAQQPAQGAHEHHQHAPAATQAPAPAPDGPVWRVDELEALAIERNPTLREAQAEVDAAAGLRRQAGRYPNMHAGVVGDELSNSPVLRGGEVGVFVEQRIVTGGKLQLARQAADSRKLQAAAVQQAQLQRVRTSIRSSFYEALAAQRLVELQRRLAELAGQAVRISQELANVGQADRPDVLQAEIEAQSAEMALVEAQFDLEAAWRHLASEVGDSTLESRTLVGDLEEFPRIDAQGALDRILAESPELALARAGVSYADAEHRRTRASVIPDIDAAAGVRNNPAVYGTNAPIGREGFFQVGVEVPLFDRKRGAIRAAEARVEAAKAEAERVQLSLNQRMADAYRHYASSTALAGRYRDIMLPKAQQAYEMYLQNFRGMSGAYPQVLIAQRNWFQLQRDYVRTLERVWTSALLIDGLLLEGALESPIELE
ncbi:MAG: TolC family protein [Bryobacterales bacterium]|nr:TolC family protein [Bryobacterales bacterium]